MLNNTVLRSLAICIFFVAFILTNQDVRGQITITRTSDTNILKNSLIVPNSGITVTSIFFTGSDSAAGTYASGPLGIDDGIILASGDVINALPPDDGPNISTDFGLPGCPPCDSIIGPGFQSFDAAILEIIFDVDDSTNSISFQFIFGSEEYPEYVGSQFNDVFGAYLNGTQIAFDENGEPITINGPFFSGGNVVTPPANGLEYDGSTGLLQTQAPVTPGSVGNSMIFVICDAGDHIYDSGVLLSSFGGNADTSGTVTGFPPEITCPDPDSINISIGNPVTFNIQANDPGAGDIVQLTVNSLPSGASMNPPLPLSGNPVSSNFSWTPSSGQTGEFLVTFTAQDTAGLTDQCQVVINVTDSTGETSPPSCELTAVLPGPPKGIEITVQDGESGLDHVDVLHANNCTVTIAPFTVGTNNPVVVTATKINNSKGASVALRAMDVAGNATTCDPVYTTISASVPEIFDLLQNYPNPFNPTTTIRFAIPSELEGAANVTLKIYDLSGREVKTLINEAMAPGEYSVDWDATNNHGDKVAGGVYLYRLVAGDYNATKKMTLIK